MAARLSELLDRRAAEPPVAVADRDTLAEVVGRPHPGPPAGEIFLQFAAGELPDEHHVAGVNGVAGVLIEKPLEEEVVEQPATQGRVAPRVAEAVLVQQGYVQSAAAEVGPRRPPGASAAVMSLLAR